MAKRMIDTDIFKKGFVKTLSAKYKLLWLYILNDCNHAGVWEVELDIASIRLGIELTENQKEILDVFGEKIVVFDNGKKWFIPSFIDFQYGELNEKNRAHESVIKILHKYGIYEYKPLASVLQDAKDKDMVKDKAKELDKEEGGVGETKPENYSKPEQHCLIGTPPYKAVKKAWYDWNEKQGLPEPTEGQYSKSRYEWIATRISQRLQQQGKSPIYETVYESMEAVLYAAKTHKFWKDKISLDILQAKFEDICNAQIKKNEPITTPWG
jgi:hypothetical protein